MCRQDPIARYTFHLVICFNGHAQPVGKVLPLQDPVACYTCHFEIYFYGHVLRVGKMIRFHLGTYFNGHVLCVGEVLLVIVIPTAKMYC